MLTILLADSHSCRDSFPIRNNQRKPRHMQQIWVRTSLMTVRSDGYPASKAATGLEISSLGGFRIDFLRVNSLFNDSDMAT